MVLGPEASPKRARAHEWVCGVDRTRVLNKRSGMTGPAVTASDKAKKFLADFFDAAALPADAVSHHRCGKRGVRIEQRREDRTHVSSTKVEKGMGVGCRDCCPLDVGT